MHDHFRAISLSYKNAPIQVRELISLDETSSARILGLLKEVAGLSEAMILSTCNRTEIYYTAPADHFEEILKLLAVEKGISSIENYFDYFETFEKNDAIQHLFYVSVGLEAQVVGDLQIANQVKRAYQQSADLDMAGPLLHRMMHTVFYTNKRIVQETAFRDGAASVSYAAVELVEEFSSLIVDPKILVVGLGEIGEDVCKNLAAARYKNVSVINRTEEKARSIASACGYTAVPFEHALQAVEESDVIISSLSGDHFFISRSFLEGLNINGYKYFIDLGVPRSVEQAAETIAGVLLYNIDNIRSKTSEALEKRIAAIPAVKEIVAESVESFKDWAREMEVSPTIKKFKTALETIRKEEMARYLKDVSKQESDKIDKITKSILQKIIKLPVIQLKAACKRGEAESLIEGLSELFDLEKELNSRIKK